MSKLKLFLLGSPQLEIDRTPIELERRKAMALLAYLAVTQKSHSRDSLATLFWPEADQSRARTTLRHHIWSLNKALGDGWLDISRETIGTDSNPDLWVDVNQFRYELAACQTHDHAAAAVCPDCLPHLREVVSLYRGDFLAGFTLRDSPDFDEWQRFESEALRRELDEALERLVRGQSAQEDFKVAIPYAQRWLALDPLHEPAHRQLMELYARAGQRAAALHQYHECERILQEELGVPPGMETTALAERIRLETAGQQGQLIKSYELKELIGAGGFGEVYRAYQPQVRREVAIKVILSQFANQPDFIRRFEAEAHMVAQLEHPHIVPLYDYWREPDGAYLVMRWLRGGSLEDALKSGPWSPEATAQLLDQIAAALMLAHQRGIIHRDLKPANILLDEGGNVYLTDFGIAKAVTASWSISQTQAGVVMGSPAYMAPEAANDEPLTPQTDIYSLGVMLFEMLTGQHPFPDTTPPMMLVKHLSEPLPPLQLPNPDLSAALSEVIQRATAKKPADRYADTISLAVDFRRALGLQLVPVTALPDKATPLLVPNPYKGLRAFQEGDAADFFGRDSLVDQLLIRLMLNKPTTRRSPIPQSPMANPSTSLRTSLHNFLAIVGPSGSGKSSLVKAGLVPALRQNAIPGSKDWFIVEMTPGPHPLEELEAALLRIAINPPPTLLDQLQADERGLLRAVKRILPDDETELLLVIDQFEEVFTLVGDKAVRAHFLDSLRLAVTESGSRLRVVITLRADFYDQPLLYEGFGNLLRHRMETILPLATEELEQAIAGPAERVGATLEAGLVPLIIADVQEQPGTLPLMQYALTELFEQRQGRLLTIEAYQASGGVMGALARRADELYTELDDSGRVATRRLFLRLVTLGEGVEDTRRRVLRSELEAFGGDEDQRNSRFRNPKSKIENVIDTFGHYRLLTFDRDPVTRGPTVEVAHEALIREWDRLRQWLDDDREFLFWQQRLRAGLHQWQASEYDEGALLRGAPLAEAENWLNQRQVDLNEAEREFIQASLTLRERQAVEREAQLRRELEVAQELADSEKRRAEEHARAATNLRKRAMWLIGVGLVAVFLAVVAAIFGIQSSQNADRAIANEQIAVAEQATAQAEKEIAAAERDQAQSALSRQLAELALNRLDDQLDLALLLGVEAAQAADTLEARNSLLTGLETNPQLDTFLQGHTDQIRSVVFNPNGQILASASDDDTIILWDVPSGQALSSPLIGHTAAVWSIAFSPDGHTLASGSLDKTIILWDVATGQPLGQPLTGHTKVVNSVAFSPDGQTLVSGSGDKTIRLWDVATGQPLGPPLTGHTSSVNSVAFSPDGHTLASGSLDKTIVLWDVATGQPLGPPLTGHTASVNSVVFSPDGQTLVSGSGDKTIRLWDVATGQPLGPPLTSHTASVNSVVFNLDGQILASASQDQTIMLWNVASRQPLGHPLIGHAAPVWSVAFSPDGQTLASGSQSNTPILWDVSALLNTGVATFQPLARKLTGHTEYVWDVAFSPDSQTLASGSKDQAIILWDTASGQPLGPPLIGHTGWVISVAFSPDGHTLASGSLDKTIRLWDVATGQPLGPPLTGHTGSVNSVDFSPDGQTLVSGSGDETIILWDVATLLNTGVASVQPLGPPLTGHTAAVWSVAFSPDGQTLASGSFDETIILWDIATGQPLGPPLTGHTGNVTSVVFSPDGQVLASTSGDNTISLWDVATRQPLGKPLTGHKSYVDGVAFSPDGRVLASGSWDHTVILWDVAIGRPLGPPLTGHTDLVTTVAFSPDSRTLVSGSRDNTIILWDVGFESWQARACRRVNRNLTRTEWQQFFGDEPYRATCPDLPVPDPEG